MLCEANHGYDFGIRTQSTVMGGYHVLDRASAGSGCREIACCGG